MTKRVLDVGQCVPDHAAIARFLTQTFECEVATADELQDTLHMLESDRFDLVLVNRKLDIDYSDGMEIIRALKTDGRFAEIPVMLVSNYPEYQDEAVAAGAHRGFGKAELGDPETVELVRAALRDDD